MVKYYSALSTGMLLFIFISRAQSADTLSLEAYVNLAKKQNPQVRISGAAVSSSIASQMAAQVSAAAAGEWPGAGRTVNVSAVSALQRQLLQ